MASPYPYLNVYGRLSSLLDVTLTAPSANFVLYYDGVDWVNATSATTAVNVGQGLVIHDAGPTRTITLALDAGGASNYTFEFPNTLGAVGQHLAVASVAGTVVTTSWASGGSITGATNLGAGSQVFAQVNGANLEFRTIVQGFNTRLTQSATTITIDASETVVNQVGHGFAAGDVVYRSNTAWALAQANAATTIATGMVVAVIDVDNFVFANQGIFTITAHGKGTAGQFVWTSPTVAGGVVNTAPSTTGQFDNPLAQVIDANNLSLLTFRAFQVP